jgi:thiol-disulfide isomerase/thioredoxin
MKTHPFSINTVFFLRFLKLFLLCNFLLVSIPFSALPANHSATQNSEKNILYFFWGEGCPHCAAAKPFLGTLKKKYPGIEIRSFEVFNDEENLKFMQEMAKSRGMEPKGVPTFILDEKIFEGFNENIAHEIEAAVATEIIVKESPGTMARQLPEQDHAESFSIPFIGNKDIHSLSLPIFTLIIAGLDSFNPCAFFVLFSLLSLLIHVHSRKRMVLIGGIFVVCSGFIYFLFMATWLNLFFVIGHLSAVTYVAGILALTISLINIKDYFFFKKGISLNIPEASKPKLFEKMRELLRTNSLPAILTGTVVLAITANSYELLCTAGFPMVYTRVLTLNSLSPGEYYGYLALYNLVYVLPLALIVAFFVATLGSRKLSEWQGRVLKLISGAMMFGLALVLLFDPTVLQNPVASVLILLTVFAVSAGIVMLTRKHLKV